MFMGECTNAARDAKIGRIIKIVGGAFFTISATRLILVARREEGVEQLAQFDRTDGGCQLGDNRPIDDMWKF